MNIQSTLNAISGQDTLKQLVGISILNKVKETQATQAATILQDFAAAQPAHLGRNLDVRV
ncbi:YjfB family protein [Paenibacillus sp. YYML68]|uniref:YjfB family protein n=1 Tax=Paenibacillus sp. YYML68 TaxID=2909250 RepID=UPI002492A82D|nr:YjfB family protein [Paenibacillus sp. YYML68]